MNYPNLVKDFMLNRTVHVCIRGDEPNEFNEKEVILDIDTKANVQFKAKEKLTSDRTLVTISGCVYFQGDICCSLSRISNGVITIDGNDYKINQGQKALNPDGTVNYTMIEIQ